MGQKLSDLKGLLVKTEGEETGKEYESDESVTDDNVKCDKLKQTGSGSESSSLNGNVAGNAKDHFESIYSNSSEINCRTDELNANLLPEDYPHTSQCENDRNQCTCSAKFKVKMTKSRKKSEDGHGSPFKRNLRTMSFVSKRRSRGKTGRTKDSIGDNVKKRSTWVIKFNCAKLKPGFHGSSSSFGDSDIPQPNIFCDSCICTGYRRTEEHHLGAGVVFEASTSMEDAPPGAWRSIPAITLSKVEELLRNNPVIDLSKFNPDDFPIEDCDERARLERAKEIAEGVEPPPGFQPGQNIQLVCPGELDFDSVVSRHLTMFLQAHIGPETAAALSILSFDLNIPPVQRIIHTQVDYIHCLVPDLLEITLSSFYWGKMDRFEAERLLEGRPEGTFLLRDSSQEEYIFSVSFRRYGRSLHARVEQWNHMFSFDSHDPGVFSSPTVCGLLEHYKDPSCCMFFEPMLAIPFHRSFPFPLQHLCRATVCSRVSYDSINQLNLPRALKSYLKEYHYKQRVRVRKFDSEL